MTFAAPIPELLDHDDLWAGRFLTSGADGSRQLPPPPPGAVPSPGPAPWLLGSGVDPFDVCPPTRGDQGVVGQEVVDAFELIWPTGEIDEQFLGGPLSEMPAPGAFSTPPDLVEPASAAPVPGDVVLAIQRAIAAIGSELEVVDEPPPVPYLPERSDASVGGVPGDRVPAAPDAGGMTMHPDPSDSRRSALRRLISGLRRH